MTNDWINMTTLIDRLVTRPSDYTV